MKFYTRQRRMPTVIIVSLIDILAILLIFVIVTTTFRQEQSEIVIKLPESKSAEAAPQGAEPQILSVDPSGEISFQGKKFRAEQIAGLKPLLDEFRKNSPGGAVALQADTKAPFGAIISVIDALKEAGFPTLPAFMEKKEQ
jgi:biopolymer transport protein ExbD